MYNERHKRIKKILLGQFIVAFGITALALFLVFFAMGYRVNFKNYSINKIGILSLKFIDHPDKIIVDGEEYKNGYKFYLSLNPGNYDIIAEKDGCYDWNSNYLIKSGQAVRQEDMIFIFIDSEIKKTDNQAIIDKLNLPDTSLVSEDRSGLKQSEYEIWYGNRLVSRFSEAINGVKWFPRNDYIAFQIGDEIRIIDTKGMNDTLLVTLNDSTPTMFAFRTNGRELYYRDGADYYIARIR